MNALTWTDDLRLDQPQMDRTHEEFVQRLAAARHALDQGQPEQALAAFDELLAHTVEHFAQEERWMQATGFAPENCHARQHASVLQVMREVMRLAREESRWEPMGLLIGELGQWFPQHARVMDAGLALHMAELGFDPVTGTAARPLPEHPLTHCGSNGCR